MMKAIQYMAAGQVSVVETEIPEPAEGEALVKVQFAGICGTDMTILAGKHPRAKAPLTLGHEFSGTIEKLNGAARGLKPGDRVTANPLISCGKCWSCRNGFRHVCYKLNLYGIDVAGAMANYLRIPIASLYRLPAQVDMDKASLAEPLAVGIHAVNMGQSVAGESAAVIGAGPIGLVTALALRCRGLKKILVTDVCQYRLDLARDLGFDAFDNAKGGLAGWISSVTGGDGVDVLYEASGHPSAVEGICGLVRCRGRIVMVSVHKDPRLLDLRAVNFKEITVVGSRCYSDAAFAEAVAALPSLPLEKLISHRLPPQEGPQGFAAMGNPNISCKVLFQF